MGHLHPLSAEDCLTIGFLAALPVIGFVVTLFHEVVTLRRRPRWRKLVVGALMGVAAHLWWLPDADGSADDWASFRFKPMFPPDPNEDPRARRVRKWRWFFGDFSDTK